MAERVDVCIVGSGLRRLDLRLAAGRALPRGGRRPEEHPRARARAALQAHRLQAVDVHRPPLGRLQPDPVHPGDRRPDRGGQRRRRRVEPLPRRASLAARDFRAPRPPPRRRPRPADVAEGDLAQDARPLLPPRRDGLRVQPAALEPGVEVRRPLGGDAERGGPHLRPRPAAPSASSCARTPSGATPAASSARRTPSTPTTSARPRSGREVRPRARCRACAARPPTATATWSRRR